MRSGQPELSKRQLQAALKGSPMGFRRTMKSTLAVLDGQVGYVRSMGMPCPLSEHSPRTRYLGPVLPFLQGIAEMDRPIHAMWRNSFAADVALRLIVPWALEPIGSGAPSHVLRGLRSFQNRLQESLSPKVRDHSWVPEDTIGPMGNDVAWALNAAANAVVPGSHYAGAHPHELLRTPGLDPATHFRAEALRWGRATALEVLPWGLSDHNGRPAEYLPLTACYASSARNEDPFPWEVMRAALIWMACPEGRCHAHPDCLAHPELGKACFADAAGPWLKPLDGLSVLPLPW